MNDFLSNELRESIERLYAVFAPYQALIAPKYCSHCVKDEEDQVLRSKPLRELSGKELARYSFKAMTTWGSQEQFKYLLPRLFELVVIEPYPYNPEILFKKPRYGGFPTWPEEERETLQQFCYELWRYTLTQHPIHQVLPSFPSIDDCLCSVAQVVDDLRPILNVWECEKSEAATRHLLDLADENASDLRERKKLSNAFWNERQSQMQQAVEWFLDQNFALVFDVVNPTVSPWDFREELNRAIQKARSAG